MTSKDRTKHSKTFAKLGTVKGHTQIELSELVHERFGHLGKSNKMLKELKKIFGQNFELPDCHCQSCIDSKGHDVPNLFNKSKRQATYRGQRLHYDVFYFDKPDRNDCKYALIVIDEYSGYRWVYILQRKSEVEDNLIHLIKHIQNLTRSRIMDCFGISQLRIDGGGENTSSIFRKFCQENGINHESNNRGR